MAYSCFYWQITDTLENFTYYLRQIDMCAKTYTALHLTVTQLIGVIYLLLKARVPDR